MVSQKIALLLLLTEKDFSDPTRREDYSRRVLLLLLIGCYLQVEHDRLIVLFGNFLNSYKILCVFGGKSVYIVKYILMTYLISSICCLCFQVIFLFYTVMHFLRHSSKSTYNYQYDHYLDIPNFLQFYSQVLVFVNFFLFFDGYVSVTRNSKINNLTLSLQLVDKHYVWSPVIYNLICLNIDIPKDFIFVILLD